MRVTFSLPVLSFIVTCAHADDWPQFRGTNRDAVWNEAGIMQTFPAEGMKATWRAGVGNGLASPVVAQGRVYLTDAELKKPDARENIRCLDEKTGQPVWTFSYEVTYPDWAFDPSQQAGPQSTPVVSGGKIYALGQMGDLLCLDAAKGTVLWWKNLMTEYGTKEFTGTTPSPLIEGSLLIAAIGAPGACVVAFDNDTGKEAWKALDDPWTYSSPNVITAGGQRQLIVWTPKSVVSLNPASGATWWREEYDTTNLYGVATPVVSGDLLLLSGLMFQLDAAKPAATVLWPEHKSGAKAVLSNTSIPVLLGGHVYSGKTNGHLVCIEARTGRLIWDTDKVTGKGQGATIHITPITSDSGSVLIFTDQGNLIRARLSPERYTELSRTHLVDPTFPFAGRKLIWPPPAYANGHIFVHSGAELLCFSLADDAH
jgi:outer membrane protein assembly factor BamB